MEHKRAKMEVPPSPVVHIRSLPPHTTPQDIHASLEPFGPIVNVSLIPNRAQGLAEFTDVHAASRCVYSAQGSQPVFIHGRRVYINFSTSQKVHNQHDRLPRAAVPGKVLLMTVMNASYPINVDVIYAVCSPLARVLRIVMIRKNGVQALVEFPDANTATAVMNQLQGANIYQGCCTLRVEYSKAERVNVRYNSEDTRDFTANLPPPPVQTQPPGHPHQYPGSAPYAPAPYAGGHAPVPQQSFDPYRGGGAGGGGGGMHGRPPFGRGGSSASWGGERRPRPSPPSPVLMVYHINKNTITCDKLFNLFCIYANPIKVKVLISKEGMAMVQFEDIEQAKRVLETLDGVEVQGQTMELGYSRNHEVTESPSEFKLPNGAPAMRDFRGQLPFRFSGATAEAGLEVQKPTPVLKFYDAPQDFSKDDINRILGLHAAPTPLEITLEQGADGKSHGRLKYFRASQATDALLACNNAKILPESSESSDDTEAPLFKLAFAAEESGASQDQTGATAPAEADGGAQSEQQGEEANKEQEASKEAGADGSSTADAEKDTGDAAQEESTAQESS